MARLCAHPHFVFPTKRPGSCFRSSFFTEKKPAWGPPYPRGTPNRCEFPRHMSAPTSPGGSNTHSASKSVATATRPCRNSTLNSIRGKGYVMLCLTPAAWVFSTTPLMSSTRPSVSGYCSNTPSTFPGGKANDCRSTCSTGTPKNLRAGGGAGGGVLGWRGGALGVDH